VDNLSYHGATVYVLGRSEAKFMEKFQQSNFDQIHFVFCDIKDGDSMLKAIESVLDKEKRIDAIINNAFYVEGNNPEELDNTQWNISIDGTLNTLFRSIRAIVPVFRKMKGGSIINVSSMYGLVAPDFDVYDGLSQLLSPPHYGAGKAGVIQLTKYYASYLGKEGIRVNCISPGPFPSYTVQQNKEFIKRLEKKTALHRIGLPEEIGGIFTFLVSDASSFVTGQNFIVDGGWTIKS